MKVANDDTRSATSGRPNRAAPVVANQTAWAQADGRPSEL